VKAQLWQLVVNIPVIVLKNIPQQNIVVRTTAQISTTRSLYSLKSTNKDMKLLDHSSDDDSFSPRVAVLTCSRRCRYSP